MRRVPALPCGPDGTHIAFASEESNPAWGPA